MSRCTRWKAPTADSSLPVLCQRTNVVSLCVLTQNQEGRNGGVVIRGRTACVVAVSVALFSGCSESTPSTTEAVVPTDSSAPATVPPSTVAATTTTVALEAFLRSDGLGPFDFGATYADAVAGMPLELVSDEDSLLGRPFPDIDYATGRIVCWNDGGDGRLCGYFGGADEDTLVLVGWDYGSSPGPGHLFSTSGVTAEILVSEVPAMPLPERDCYGETVVMVDGIRAYLSTRSNERFGTYTESGTFVPADPPPAGAIVQYLVAGDIFFGEGTECFGPPESTG